MEGFLHLQSPDDLLRKLAADLAALDESPLDTYRAFNFFVTAEHMPDWVYPGRVNEPARRQLRESEAVLRICSHLANGMKHFRVEAKHHQSVQRAERRQGVYSNVYGNAYGNVFGRKIVIHLDAEARAEFGDTIAVTRLAHRVFEFWHSYLKA